MHTPINAFFLADKFLPNEAEIMTLEANLINEIIFLHAEYDISSE